MSRPAQVPIAATHFARDTCLCLEVQRMARILARRFDAAFRPLGLNNRQFSLLCALNRPSPPAMSDVASLLGVDRTTLTAALKPLERDGLVAVEADAHDKRSRRLVLTSAGASRLACALTIWRDTHDELERGLRTNEIATLRRTAARLAMKSGSQQPRSAAGPGTIPETRPV